MSRQSLKRAAIVRYSDQSIGVSCRVITSNLARAYDLQNPQSSVFSISRRLDPGEVWRTAQAIAAAEPGAVIFTDDQNPHPKPLLLALHRILGKRMPPLYFHVYGNFVANADQWVGLEKELTGVPVTFICASTKHGRLLKSLLKNGRHVRVCPFPVDPEKFYFDAALRKSQRLKLGLGKDAQMILYTGRLTFQKNVLRLISETARLMQDQPQEIHLFLAGFIDLSGDPYNFQDKFGLFYQALAQQINVLPPRLRSRVHLLDNLNADELRAHYNAADLFISLSTFHDDDFGMSPIEALFTGCPSVLTDWGGLASFNIPSAPNRFVSVHLDRVGLRLSTAQIQLKMREALVETRALTDVGREQRGRDYRAAFSLRAVSKALAQIQQEDPSSRGFCGYTPAMKKLAARTFQMRNYIVPLFPRMNRGSFYHSVYRSYFGQESNSL